MLRLPHGLPTDGPRRRQGDALSGLRLSPTTPLTRRVLPWGLAVLAGLFWAGSHPPLGAWPLSFLVVALQGAAILLATADVEDLPRTLRRAAAVGVVTGTVAFGTMIPWIANIQPGGAAAWPVLSLIEGAYVGAFAMLVAPWLRRRWFGAAALALGHVGMEVVRASFPAGGFGWGELAYAHVGGSWLLPLARIGGAHLVTLVVALLGALLFEAWRQGRDATRGLTGRPVDHLAAALPHGQRAMFAVAGVLLVSLVATVEPPATNGTADVLIVQGNDFEDPPVRGLELDRLIARQHLELTREALRDGPVPDVIVWPESAVDADAFAGEDDVLLDVLREGAELARGGLLVGMRRQGPERGTFRNAVVHVDAQGQLVAQYDKRHLVPFGEYLPLRAVLGDLGPFRAIGSDGIPGEEPTHLLPGVGLAEPVRVAVAICFETLFGDLVRDNVLGDDGDLAQLVVAATNDASFGRGAQPPQHLDQSRMRAIETGRWVAHAAISGTSAFVAPDGTVHGRTEVFEQAVLRRSVPLAEGRTPFLVTGDLAGRLGLVALGLLALSLLAMLAPTAWDPRTSRRAERVPAP